MDNTYWDYIKVEELLQLQNGIEADEHELANDEVLFIVVHQVHELWFKLILRELESSIQLFGSNPVPENSLAAAARGLRRIAKILGLATQHFTLIETMTTRDYLDFRDKLSPASGFQSAQFREIEILMGLEGHDRIPFSEPDDYLKVLRNRDGSKSAAFDRVRRRLDSGLSLRNVLEQWLYRTPIEGSQPGGADDERVVRNFLERFLQNQQNAVNEAMQRAQTSSLSAEDRDRIAKSFDKEMAAAREYFLDPKARRRRTRAALLFIESYRELPLLSWPREILDVVIEMEQCYLIFRQRHARMVERMIGRRIGTGGSDGVGYLDETALKYRIFPDLWQVRTFLVRKDRIPPLEHTASYQFRAADP